MKKRTLYLDLWYVCGLLTGVLVAGIISYIIIRFFDASDLSLGLIFGFGAIMGLVYGHWAGPVAWKMIYIDGRRGKKYILKEGER